MLVEDDPDRVQLTQRALEEHELDIEVEVATTGEEALQRLAQEDDPLDLDLVLLDLKLEGTSGFDVLDGIRSNPVTRRLPVVVLTSSLEAEDRRTSYDLGANSFVTKPVDFHTFRSQIQKVSTYWLTIDEGP